MVSGREVLVCDQLALYGFGPHGEAAHHGRTMRFMLKDPRRRQAEAGSGPTEQPWLLVPQRWLVPGGLVPASPGV